MKFINRVGAAVCAYGGPDLAWRLATGAARRPVVLTYHRVLSGNDGIVDKTQRDFTEREFQAHVECLLSRRRPVTLYDIVKGEIGGGRAVSFRDYRIAPTTTAVASVAAARIHEVFVAGVARQTYVDPRSSCTCEVAAPQTC